MSQQADRNQLWQYFSAIDTNRSGTLEVMELQKALALGGLHFSLKLIQGMMRLHDKDATGTIDFNALMRLHDRDGNGSIDFNEFEKLHHWLTNITASFKHFDNNRGSNGTLDKEEARAAVQHAGYRLEGPAFDALYKSFDPDRTNSLCLAEFIAMSVFLQGAARTFHAFDAQRTGRITLDFSQFVYAASNVM